MARGHRRRNVGTSAFRPTRPRLPEGPEGGYQPGADPYDTVAWWKKKLTDPLFVYFIQHGEDGPVKIGKALDPASRVRELQCGNPYPLTLVAVVLATEETEESLHVSWAAARIRGEWFDGDDVKEILRRARNCQLKQVQENPDRRMGHEVYRVARLAGEMCRQPNMGKAWL